MANLSQQKRERMLAFLNKVKEEHRDDDKTLIALDEIESKFNVFKQYAQAKNLNWGFVRDKDGELYINNTVFAEDIADENWVSLSEKF